MQAKNEQSESKRKRRRGSFAAEIAEAANVSVRKAKRCIKICKDAPELVPFIESGALTSRDAVKILGCARLVPDIIPALVNGSVDLDWFIQELRN
jgi:hypothetical protein